MANYKAEIAEALYDSSTKISKEALIWAMTNLPDTQNKGSFSGINKSFDHDKENIFEAVGISKYEAEQLARIMSKQLASITEPEGKVSRIVEGVLNEIEHHPNLIKLIVIKTVQEALQFVTKSETEMDIIKMIQLIKKLKNED